MYKLQFKRQVVLVQYLVPGTGYTERPPAATAIVYCFALSSARPSSYRCPFFRPCREFLLLDFSIPQEWDFIGNARRRRLS